MKRMFLSFLMVVILPAFADSSDDIISNAEQIFEATRITCSGISDEIAKVANISKANTAVTAVGTVAAGGALIAGSKNPRKMKK